MAEPTMLPAWTHTGYAQQVVFGRGTIERLPESIRALGVRRVLLVTTAGRLGSDDGQRVVKALLGYGARLPKELMLYVKNMVFIDGAIARLAPDLDILAEVANISMHFATRHGARLGAELGLDAVSGLADIDLTAVKAGFGLDQGIERLTHRELQERRALIQKRVRHSEEVARRRRR